MEEVRAFFPRLLWNLEMLVNAQLFTLLFCVGLPLSLIPFMQSRSEESVRCWPYTVRVTERCVAVSPRIDQLSDELLLTFSLAGSESVKNIFVS